MIRLLGTVVCALFLSVAGLATSVASAAPPEVRGTWVTTTANDAIATPAKTAATMKKLRDIGLNTVYVECWKNGYTEFPSEALNKAIGVSHKLNLPNADPNRDLLKETLDAAHENGLVYIAWFEYGFMAAHRSTHNELRARKDWLSLDQQGNEVAKNGFVWLNPLHPDAQQLLIDVVVEAVKKYDVDGVQIDDRIVWPGLEMGYDAYTKQVYAAEHGGKEPPKDIMDPEWMTWRAGKVNEFSKRFVKEVRTANPKVMISLSPAPYPWCYDHYLCDWPTWAKWDARGGQTWDEYLPQVYRMNYQSFETTWRDQLQWIGGRKQDLVAGIRVVGDGPDLPWEDLKKSIELTRATGSGGHCLWFSRGVLDVYPEQLKAFYDVEHRGHAPHPHVER
jgi:uncharacterized lipoprotein YddW (UPF0748 family)